MKNKLNDRSVLVLDNVWRVTNVTSPKQAIVNMANDTMTAISNDLQTYSFDDWIKLPVEEGDEHISTARGKILLPKIVMATNFSEASKVHRTPKITPRDVMKVYDGKCWWTGKKIGRKGTIEHYNPRSKGGKNDWSNIFWADPRINALKKDMSPDEFAKKHGFRPIAALKKPTRRLMVNVIEPREDRPEWNRFLLK